MHISIKLPAWPSPFNRLGPFLNWKEEEWHGFNEKPEDVLHVWQKDGDCSKGTTTTDCQGTNNNTRQKHDVFMV